jgi:hypothetical protein
MATEPNWHPVDEEIEQILADNPDLVDELKEFDEAYERGEAELVPDDDVRRRLEALGLKLAPRPSEEDQGTAAS